LDVLELTLLPSTAQDRARQQHAAEYVSQPTRAVYAIGLNVSKPPLDDRRVRRALMMAIDRERLADIACGGRYFPATGGLWPPCTAIHSPGIALPYDPERARGLLAEAGYPNGRAFPAIKALGVDIAQHRLAVEDLRAQWRENLGIDVPWQVLEFHEFFEKVRVGTPVQLPQMWYTGVALGIGRDDQVFQPIEGWFAAGWQNEDYQRLDKQVRHVVDLEERLRICREADRILVEEAPTLFLMYERLGLLVKPWVTRLPLAPCGGPWWKDAVIEPHEC
jgi:ABC-type transport system substrate-binding protein